MLSPKTYCNPNNFLFRENNSDITIEAHRFLNGDGDNSGCPHGRFRASVRYDKNTIRGRAFDWVSQSLSKRNRNGQSERKKISRSQWELKFRTSQLSEPRENTVGQIAFGFSFEWDCFGKWCEFSVPIMKPKQTRMTFDTQLKIVLLSCISVGVIEVMKKRREILFELPQESTFVVFSMSVYAGHSANDSSPASEMNRIWNHRQRLS